MGAVLAIALLAGCAAPPAGLVVAGTVVDRQQTVAVPALPMPAVDLGAGFPAAGTPEAPPQPRATSPVASTYGLGTSLRIAEVAVAEGDQVRAGQLLARVDAAPLRAQVAVARADAAVAAAQVDVLAAAIEETYDRAAELADAKREVADAIDQLQEVRAKLLSARARARAARPQLVRKLREVEAALANYPPVVPPDFRPTRAELEAAARKLRTAIRQVDAGLRQIRRNLPKLSAGLRKARDGLARLQDATAKLADARARLRDLKELAEIAAETGGVPLQLAKVQLRLADLTAPVAGVVVSVAAVGDRLAPGAPAVTIRESGPSRVSAWLSEAQLATVCPGDAARLTADWLTGEATAELSRIGTRADYPPTSVPTDEVHLTRAVPVELTTTTQLPAGLPVDVLITGCNPAGSPTRTDR